MYFLRISLGHVRTFIRTCCRRQIRFPPGLGQLTGDPVAFIIAVHDSSFCNLGKSTPS